MHIFSFFFPKCFFGGVFLALHQHLIRCYLVFIWWCFVKPFIISLMLIRHHNFLSDLVLPPRRQRLQGQYYWLLW